MSKLKGFYQNNRVFVILMGVSSICLIIILSIVVIYFFDQTSGDAYGNRLNGIETVELTNQKLKKIEETLKQDEKVDKVTVHLKGKIVYINCYLHVGKATDAKNIAINALTAFSEDERAYYDISFIFDKTDQEDRGAFPVMGYKKSDNNIISWTNIVE